MTTKPMPPWLQAHLIQTGVMTKDRITKHARPRRCTCGLFTLTGLDDVLPKVVAVDPMPTTTIGEAHALLAGRATYSLDGDELFVRTAGRIGFRNADQVAVYATHQCGVPNLPISARFAITPSEDLNADIPPF